MPQSTVVGVSVSPKHTFSKTVVDSITLIENFGVEGDAHAGATDQHLFHIRRYGRTPNLRQVHLIHAELFDELAQSGHAVHPGDLGENVVTQGIELLNLPTGACLQLGPEVMRDQIDYFRECRLLDEIRVTLALAGLSEDGSRMTLRNEFHREGLLCARVTSTVGWFDLRQRKLIVPPPGLAALLRALDRSDDFAVLPGSAR